MPTITDAETALTRYDEAVTRHVVAATIEAELTDARPVQKHEAILRIMAEQSQPSGKPHSYSSAEAVVETDADYAAHLAAIRRATAEAKLTAGQREAARLRVELMLAVLKCQSVEAL